METLLVHYLAFGQFKNKAEAEKIQFKVLNAGDVEFGSEEYYKVEVSSEQSIIANEVLASIGE